MRTKLSQHLFAILFAIFLIVMGMLPTIVNYAYKPEGRVYTGLQGFLDDYVGYVSYIKEGMYGRNFVAIRSLPKDNQKPTSILLVYIAIGKIASILGLSAPVAYHLSRVVISFAFIMLIYLLFFVAFKTSGKALLALFFATLGSHVSWYAWKESGLAYKSLYLFDFSTNLVLRMISRPHYEFGGILFVAVVLMLFVLSKRFNNNIVTMLLAVSAFLLATVHPTFAFILGAACACVLGVEYIDRTLTKQKTIHYLVCVLSVGIGLLLTYWSMHRYPFSSMYSFEEYVRQTTITARRILYDAISFGPILWFGYIGLIISLLSPKMRTLKLFFFFWVTVQMSSYFIFYPLFRAEKVRFIQSLYFIPLAYGTVYFFEFLAKITKKQVFYAGILLLIAANIPTYINDFKSLMVVKKSINDYSAFDFPSTTIVEGYEYLDKNTPKESVVLAGFEAANNILLYSHNFVIGNRQGWEKQAGDVMENERNAFFLNLLAEQEMIDFLRKYNIDYVFGGYQEQIAGIFDKHPSLFAQIYQNNEVKIYKVILAKP